MSIIKKYLGPEDLKKYFIAHLNSIYNATLQLVKRLPEMEVMAHFKDLRNAISETTDQVEKQILRMNDIYSLLNTKNSSKKYNGLADVVDDTFKMVKQQSKDPVQRDMSMMFYLQNIESVEMASFQALQVAAVKLNNDQVKRLLQENFESAKADKALLLLISAKYITN